MSAERALAVVQAQTGGRITLGSLAQKLQEETLDERIAQGLKPLHMAQVQRWVDQLERDGSVSTSYLRQRGRPMEVAAREYRCAMCQGSGDGYTTDLCVLCDGAGMVTR